MSSIAKEIDPAINLRTILSRVASARDKAIKPALETHLVAISKNHDSEWVELVLGAGHRIFGESRVQEAMAKWPALKARFAGVELHLVGSLQSNKVADAVSLFDCVHSLDREKLATTFALEKKKVGRCPNLFIQVNVGEEPQKAGIAPRQTEEFVKYCREELQLPVIGLMCIPPAQEEPSPYFTLLQKFSCDLSLNFLSMGMSNDFETAIRFGATHVRIGTAIFGERK